MMVVRVLLAGLVAYGLLLVFLFFMQSRMLFLPNVVGRDLIADPGHLGLSFDSVEIDTADGERIHAWWVPREQARGTLLFSHGNAGNISHRLDSLRIFNDLGLNVLMYDYRGYGQSTGRPSEQGVYKDAEAAFDWLVEQRDVSPEQVVLFGRSLGGAVSAELATRRPAACLITESTFSSVPDVAAEIYWWIPVRWLARLRFDAADALTRTELPVLIIHSPDDEIISFANAERLMNAGGERARLLEIRGDHNSGFMVSGELYRRGLDEFIADCLGS